MTAFEVAHNGQFLSAWGLDREGLGLAFRLLVLTIQLVVVGGIAMWCCRTFGLFLGWLAVLVWEHLRGHS